MVIVGKSQLETSVIKYAKYLYGTSEEFSKYKFLNDAILYYSIVQKCVVPIQKKDLIIGNTYSGICYWVMNAIWDGELFHRLGTKSDVDYRECMYHYEDECISTSEIFVPIEINKDEFKRINQ